MAFDVKNPLEGLSKNQRIAVIGGGTATLGVLVFLHHKKTGSWNPWSSATPSDSSGNASSAVDPVTGLPYSEDNQVDSITGQTYLAEADQYGSVAAAEASVSAYGQSTASGSGIPVNPASPASSGSVNTVVGTSVYTSNAAWAQAATNGLADIGYSATDVSAALADYLTQTPVSTAQAQLINTAIAEYGPAPVGNLQVILASPSTPGTTTTSTKPSVENGRVSSVTTTRAVVAWTGSNAVKYGVKIVGPGKINGQTNTVTEAQASYSGLEAGHNYTVYITPYNSAGTAGTTGHVDFTTSKA